MYACIYVCMYVSTNVRTFLRSFVRSFVPFFVSFFVCLTVVVVVVVGGGVVVVVVVVVVDLVVGPQAVKPIHFAVSRHSPGDECTHCHNCTTQEARRRRNKISYVPWINL